jgi:tRNA threonylcarbamoyladenosine biosynthesis protein TsaE
MVYTHLDSTMIALVSSSPEQTLRLGECLGQLLHGGEVICLEGQLGAGKTCLAQGIGRGWGAADDLTSPTFTLIHELHRSADRAKLYHVDLYRLDSEAQAWLLGLTDLMDEVQASVLIEWPERAPTILPADRLWITLDYIDETHRRLTFHATGETQQAMLDAFEKQAAELFSQGAAL